MEYLRNKEEKERSLLHSNPPLILIDFTSLFFLVGMLS